MANMANQMELFDEGGLMQEGGTVDPVSGNDVPVGSTQEEVRDDIPAQLSEGEFVMPADVVRYHGLDKMMALRDEAKMGLQRMEDMGQMGNSEEAIIPDGVPFNLNDLDMEDDGLEMAQGGAVPMPGFTGVGGFAPPAPVTTGFSPAPIVQQPVAAASSAQQTQAGTLPGTQFIPTTVQQALPTFQGTVGMGVSGVDYEEVEYINDAGQIIKLKKSKSTGELLEPVPPGFRLKTDAVDSTQTGSTTVQTTQVSDGDGGDNQDFGRGTSLTTGEKIAGYSPEEIKTGVTSAKERFAITGNRGFDILNLVPGGTFLKDLAGKIGGPINDVASNLFGKDPIYSQDMRGDIFGVKGGEKGLPGERFSGEIADARYGYEQTLGTKMTGYVGFEKGDLDPNSGGFFNSRGVAVDKDGKPTTNELGTKNFSSFTDFKNHMAAATASGWYGGELSKGDASKLNPKAAANYRNYVTELNKQYPDSKIEGPKIATPTSSPRRSVTPTVGVGETGPDKGPDKGVTVSRPTVGVGEDGPDRGITPSTGDGRDPSEVDAGAGVSRSDDPFSMDYSGPPGSEDNMGIGEDGPDRGPVNQQTVGDSLFEGTGTQGDGPSSDPCFITTAIVEKKGEADDGETLTKLRKFRNEYMADKQEEVQEYYEIAPKIVEAVDNDEEWKWIEEQIQKAVDYIDEEKHDDAYTTYKSMVSTLKEKWLV